MERWCDTIWWIAMAWGARFSQVVMCRTINQRVRTKSRNRAYALSTYCTEIAARDIHKYSYLIATAHLVDIERSSR
jgi:hypothetical protein